MWYLFTTRIVTKIISLVLEVGVGGRKGGGMEERLMSEIGTLTGEDPAERVEMALGQPITSREQSPERTLQEGESTESHNNCTI